MRIHFQNDPDDPIYSITPVRWAEACARAGADPAAHIATYGDTDPAFAAAIPSADILVSATNTLAGRFPCNAAALKLIFLMSAGVDRLRPFSNLPAGVVVANNSGVHAAKAGEYSAMAVLMLNAAVPDMLANQRAQKWQAVYRSSLRGRHVTIVGAGDMGASAARALRSLGAIVTGVRTRAVPHPDFDAIIAIDGLDSLLPRTDFLILACPLTDATENLLNASRIALLPKGAGVINIGRGGLVMQDPLCDALDSGHLGGAVLDVFTPEPIPDGHRLWTTSNLVITPHVSVDDPATYAADTLDLFLLNLAAFESGAPLPNQVDLSRGY